MQFKHYFGDRGLSGSTWGQTALADLDGDGDLDICSTVWQPIESYANGGRNHFGFLENLAK